MNQHLIDRLAEEWAQLDPVDPLRGLIADAIAEMNKQPAQDEPVAWAISYDGKTPYSLWDSGDGDLLDLEVRRQGGTTCKMPLYTRPQALEQAAQQEPVGQLQEETYGRGQVLWFNKPADQTMLYTRPQAREPLSREEIERIYDRYGGDMVNCTRAIERAHGIKGDA